MTENKRIKGKIIAIVEGKGYGFIASPDIQFERIFFHWSALTHDTKRFRDLQKGMFVEFTPVQFSDKETGADQGYRALKIKVVDAVDTVESDKSNDDTDRKVS